jgi:hypothetical protein
MRVRYWLFTVSVLLFVGGIAFIIAAERTRRGAPAASTSVAPAATPTATVKQIMKGMTGPAAGVIFNAVSVEVSAAGTVEKAPQTDEEWATVATSAALLIESANLLVQGNRAVDTGDWSKMAKDMAVAGQRALKHAQAHDKDGILEVGEAVNTSCDSCHARYVRN